MSSVGGLGRWQFQTSYISSPADGHGAVQAAALTLVNLWVAETDRRRGRAGLTGSCIGTASGGSCLPRLRALLLDDMSRRFSHASSAFEPGRPATFTLSF